MWVGQGSLLLPQAQALGATCCAACKLNVRRTGSVLPGSVTQHRNNSRAAHCLQAWPYGPLKSTTQPVQVASVRLVYLFVLSL
jgi:hypothetical protein